MQGQETERGIINALNRIADKISFFDLVVIIRGGGSQTDLSWFDNYNIAYHVTQFPIPVITGIGHEKDLSVTDMVAHLSLKTPTAVADYLIDCVAQIDSRLGELSSDIKSLAHAIIEKNSKRIESAGLRIMPLSKVLISGIRENLSGMMIDVMNKGKKYVYQAGMEQAQLHSRLRLLSGSYLSGRISLAERMSLDVNRLTRQNLRIKTERLRTLENTLNILSPDKVLSRGYTITSINGKILRKGKELKENDIIETLFPDGSIKSSVSHTLQKRK
jgi:exodeoxyribonuclease VII large subunit